MTYLVTGAMGCLGVWTLKHLVEQGKPAIAFDLNDSRHRLNLLLSPQAQAAIQFEQGDLRDFARITRLFEENQISHVIHLAALQVPFCRANPVMGAEVNVVGTVNIFEAARLAGLKHLAYASSIAVYGSDYDTDLIGYDAPFQPHTLYGVYKQANEGMAQVYWEEHHISSIALRPYTVYGLGRDQGLTSEPTKAMLAAAGGQDFHISFGGKMQFQFASDVARYFILAAETPLEGSFGFNLGTPVITVQALADEIMKVRPEVSITVGEQALPFPSGFDDTELKKHLKLAETPLEVGIQETIEGFQTCLQDGRIALG